MLLNDLKIAASADLAQASEKVHSYVAALESKIKINMGLTVSAAFIGFVLGLVYRHFFR